MNNTGDTNNIGDTDNAGDLNNPYLYYKTLVQFDEAIERLFTYISIDDLLVGIYLFLAFNHSKIDQYYVPLAKLIERVQGMQIEESGRGVMADMCVWMDHWAGEMFAAVTNLEDETRINSDTGLDTEFNIESGTKEEEIFINLIDITTGKLNHNFLAPNGKRVVYSLDQLRAGLKKILPGYSDLVNGVNPSHEPYIDKESYTYDPLLLRIDAKLAGINIIAHMCCLKEVMFIRDKICEGLDNFVDRHFRNE